MVRTDLCSVLRECAPQGWHPRVREGAARPPRKWPPASFAFHRPGTGRAELLENSIASTSIFSFSKLQRANGGCLGA
jgi:hypothetical protein